MSLNSSESRFGSTFDWERSEVTVATVVAGFVNALTYPSYSLIKSDQR